MNFDEQILGGALLGRRRPSRRRRKVKVNVRTKGQKGLGRVRLAVFILVPTVIAAVGVLAWFGFRIAVESLFSENELFTMTNLDIRNGHVVVRDFIRGKKGIREGTNLFAFCASDLRDEFLRQAPSFSSIEIRRQLPSTLIVDAVERVPVARFGRRGHLVVDGEGFVFSVGGSKRHLPQIDGYRGPSLKPAVRLQGPARDAVRLLDACRRSGIAQDVVITAVDVSGGFGARENSMRLTLDHGTKVLFWWKRASARSRHPSEDLLNRLRFLRGVLRRAAEQDGRVPRTVNLTLDSYKQNIPTEY